MGVTLGRGWADGGLTTDQMVLGMAGYSSQTSPWQAYMTLAGLRKPPAAGRGPIEEALEATYLEHLEERHGAMLGWVEGAELFGGAVRMGRLPRLVIPGGLIGSEGDAVVLEMPTRASYQDAWVESGQTRIPFRVRARAVLAMAALGAGNALLWVVGDNGAIDEFHVVPMDQGILRSLEAAVGRMAGRLEAGDPPDPEDDDLTDALALAHGDGSNSTEAVGPDDPVVRMEREYDAALSERLALDRSSAVLKKKESELKNGILRRLREGAPRLRLPDGRHVSYKVVRTAPQSREAGQWTRLDVERADG